MQRYQRKQLKGIDQLNLEQERINRACHKIEKDWIETILSPQKIAFNVATGLISRLSGGKKTGSTENTHPVLESVKTVLQHKTVQRLALLTGKSWLRWQAFNLAVFIGKKAYQAIRKRFHKQPAPSKQDTPASQNRRRTTLLKMK